MESIRNVLDSALSAIKDRLLNPFYVAYVLAWSALNFRLILVLVSKGTSQEKIAYIDGTLYPSWQTGLTRGLFIPFAAAVIYVLASPYVFRWVTLYQRKVEKKTLVQVYEVLGETPMPKAQAEKIWAQLRESKARHEQELSDARAEIDQLQEQVDRLQIEQRTLRSEGATAGIEQTRIPRHGDGVTVEEDGEEEEAGESEQNGTLGRHKRVHFSESEFTGIALRDYHALKKRGMSIPELQVLYKVRNEKPFLASEFGAVFLNEEQFAVHALLDLFRDLNLLEEIKSIDSLSRRELVRYRISKLGRIVVKLALEAGYIGSP